jgi:hypothetical protein
MGDPQGKMRLQVLFFAYCKYKCVSYVLRRRMNIFYYNPFQRERMPDISDNTIVILRPHPPQI